MLTTDDWPLTIPHLTRTVESSNSFRMYKIIGADGKEYGPVTADQVRQWIAQGRVNAQTHAAAQGMTEWRPLGSFPEFQFVLTAAAPVAAAVVRSTSGFAI